jgi:hypothetical protein
LQWWLLGIEYYIGTFGCDGFAVGGQPSLADAMLYSSPMEDAPELKGGLYESSSEPMGNKALVARALLAFPKVSRCPERFRCTDGMQKWLKGARGPQAF